MSSTNSLVNVLIIEDEPAVRKVISDFLRMNRFSSKVATTAEAGIDEAVLLNPKVIIVDIGLPDHSGVDVVKYLQDQGIKAKFIIITGQTDFECNCNGVVLLHKPFSIKRLLEELQ